MVKKATNKKTSTEKTKDLTQSKKPHPIRKNPYKPKELISAVTKEKGVTEKQKLFALEFAKDLNATAAYKKVYWVSQLVAETAWPRLLGNVWVMEIVRNKIANRFQELEIDGKWVLDRLVELVDRCMERKPVMVKIGKTTVQKTAVYEDPNTWEEQVVWVRTFDSAWANSALDKLWKYFKLFAEQHEHTIKKDVNDMLDSILK